MRDIIQNIKIEVCKKQKIKLIVVPNNFAKAYEEIKQTIIKISKDKNDFEQFNFLISLRFLISNSGYFRFKNIIKANKKPANRGLNCFLVDHTGLEPVTFTMPL